ncbi:MAG: type II toxin-antitoxin system RelE/ParE family toxin [Verrucomicrobia subdivision 3 bacterium]|nr:type II toxin-antitoxin system RelE/ParE family toxin [Limisphaerales bacterium]
MSWRVEFRPEVEADVAEAAALYAARQPGLGAEFVAEVIRVWDTLAENPLLQCRRHPRHNLRWRYPDRFPYRVIYVVNESAQAVLVVAVLHAARQDRHWQKRN